MSDTGYAGVLNETSGVGEYNGAHFAMQLAMARINTSTLVRVVAVTNAGELSPVGFVDVQPLVHQLDGALQVMPHGQLFHLPYIRIQGGTNAIIIDPAVGDIGAVLFADRDISVVKATKDEAAPGSGRRFSMSDGLYVGGFLNATPVQYIRFTADGINIVSPTKITLSAPEVEINGATLINGATTVNGNFSQGAGDAGGAATMLGPVTVTNDVSAGGKSLSTHTHSGVQPGNGSTSTPD